MRIVYTAIAAGPMGTIQDGEVLEMNKKEAMELIEAGYARPWRKDEDPDLETAMAGAPENASTRPGRPRHVAE